MVLSSYSPIFSSQQIGRGGLSAQTLEIRRGGFICSGNLERPGSTITHDSRMRCEDAAEWTELGAEMGAQSDCVGNEREYGFVDVDISLTGRSRVVWIMFIESLSLLNTFKPKRSKSLWWTVYVSSSGRLMAVVIVLHCFSSFLLLWSCSFFLLDWYE